MLPCVTDDPSTTASEPLASSSEGDFYQRLMDPVRPVTVVAVTINSVVAVLITVVAVSVAVCIAVRGRLRRCRDGLTVVAVSSISIVATIITVVAVCMAE